MKDNNRNFILAIVLSMVVLFAWQFFIAGPQINQARKQQEIAQKQAAEKQKQQAAATASQSASGESGTPAAGTTAGAAAPAAAPAAQTVETRAEALAQSKRVPIQTPSVTGSISLTGGRVDDIRLNHYHETVNKKSPTIILLSPSGGPNAAYAGFGWTGPATAGPLPGPTTQWSAPAGAMLTPETPVTLTYDNGHGLVFNRKIAIDKQYMVTVTDSVTNKGSAPVALSSYGRITRVGVPTGVINNFILHEGLIGWIGSHGLQQYKYSDIEKNHEVSWTGVTGGWLGFTDKYWAATLIPNQTQPYTAHYTATSGKLPVFQTDYSNPAQTVAPGATISDVGHLFAGAKQVSVLSAYASKLHIEKFDLLIDWGWFFFLTKPMFYLIDWLYRLFGNFGVAILAVTVLVKLAFFPLANKSYKSMSQMKKLQPQMTALREQYKDDKVKQQEELMKLYRTEKINPLAGCWPMVIQIPVFYSLYTVLFITIEMRHAPFFGWIHDLSAPDPTHIFNLFGLLPYDPASVPFIGHFLAIGIWPVLMGITMFVQMKLNPTPPDPTQAMLFTWMPVVFTFMLASFPAGLVIYWAWNNTLSVTQQYIIMRRQGTEVNLLGNILETFGIKHKKKPVHIAEPSASHAPATPKAANDSAKPAEKKPAEAGDKPQKSTVKSRRAAAKAKARAKAGKAKPANADAKS